MLHIRASDPEEKAIVYQYPSGTGSSPERPPGHLFRLFGGDMIVEGLAVTGYFEPDDTDGDYDQLYTVQGGLFRTDSEGASITLRNNIFSNVAGQVLRVEAAMTTLRMEENVLANLGALSTSNFGAGKGVDLRESSVDSLIVTNNTFVNYQDRPIRHYNWGNPEEGTGDIVYGLFDHNTFVNGMGFHGVLSLGNIGNEMTITNNLFVDAFAAGEDPTDEERTFEWGNVGEEYENGNNRMSWIFGAPDEDVVWTVHNNYYSVTAEGQAWLDKHEDITVGDPLSNFIREQLGDDADDAFTMIDDPQMANIPDLMIGMMDYYVDVAGKTKDTPNDTWDPATQDFDRWTINQYVNDFDASYSTSSEAYTGSSNGSPVGALNWFGLPTSIENIDRQTPGQFTLNQNYPNPFNPTTTISYELPQTAFVTISVYNLLGQRMTQLVNQQMGSGSHSVSFDASTLSSGMYIYRLEAGDFVQTRSMTLIK